MDRETRSDKMYRQLNEFIADSSTTKAIVLYKSEVEKLEKHLYEKDIAVEVTEKKELGEGKIRIILQKM